MRRLKLPKPHQLVLVVGALVALGTLVSGIAPRITEWTDHSNISREPFGGIPDAMYWAFYVTAAVMLFVCAWLVSQRVRNYERGAADDRRTTKRNLHRRMRDFRAGVWMQTLLRDPAAGLMHSFIYFGFMWLFIATVVLETRPPAPRQPEVPPRRRLRGIRVRRRPRRRGVHHRNRVGARPALHRTALPHPDQDQARGRGDPHHVPRDRGDRLLHRGLPDRVARPSRLREVVVHRLSAVVAVQQLVVRRRSRTPTSGSGASTSPPSWPSSSSCPPRSSAT